MRGSLIRVTSSEEEQGNGMSTNTFDYGFGQTHPGQAGNYNPGDMMFPPGNAIGTQNPFGFAASNLPSAMFGKMSFPVVGGGFPYAVGEWTATVTGTGAAAAQSTNGGVLLTCGSDSTFNTNLQSRALWTPVANKRVIAAAILQTSDITTVGFEFNIGTSAVDPGTTNYTDVVGIKMAVGAGTMVGKVRGDSGTQSNSSTLYTATAATDFFVALQFNLGVPKSVDTKTTVTTGASSATQTVGNTAGMAAGDVLYFATTAVYRTVISVTNSTTVVVDATLSTTTAEVVTVFIVDGGFWAGADHLSATYTAFSAAQKVQAGKMLTTPQSMYLNLHAKGSASNPTVTYAAAFAQVDR
jgi:hypothetical protein